MAPEAHVRLTQLWQEKGVPTALVMFEGEQHGFRQAANIRRALDSELEFYGRVFGFTPQLAEDHEPLQMGSEVVVPIARL
eukprot:COSAG05_NODE_5626_length_1127_cov_1.318093_2_plen_80_part_00